MPQQEQLARHASRDDEVFFHKAGQPVSGKVLAAGRHGCTVEHGGKPHKVRWEHIAGHKKRAPLNYSVVEEGEDGMIVQDQHGKRRLARIPAEARRDQLELEPVAKGPNERRA
jgi:hypothetical protein